jgi:hypothetical protein
MDERTQNLIAECKRQEESCLYTSTSLYIWLRSSRFWKRIFIVAPIIFGGLATWVVLDQPELKWLTALFALIAGFFPAIYEALKLDVHLDEIARHAAEYKNLQDRFRQAATITALGTHEELQAQFEQLMERMEAARTSSLTPPEWCFEKARKKIQAGHYTFSGEDATKQQ